MQGNQLQTTELLKSTVFQVCSGDQFVGTGFFVGTGIGITCAHVVLGRDRLRIRYQGAWLPATVLSVHPAEPSGDGLYPMPDLAFLEVDITASHPTVLLSSTPPRPGSQLFGLGFATSDAPGGERPQAEGVFVEVTGPSGEAVRVRGDQIVPGLSGSPLLDLDERRVCAVLKTSRHVHEVRGGWAVPIGLVEDCRPGLLSTNGAGHPPGTAWRDLTDGRANANRALFTTAQPNRAVAPPADPAPSWWLNPRNRVADYLRPDLYDDLLAWCRAAAPEYPVRLVVGPGGAGKTRLALELREQLAAEGWIAGSVSLASDIRRIAERLPDVAERHRVMVAVDYAETLHTDLDELLQAVERSRSGSVRILLLARSIGPWWGQLRRSSVNALLIDRAVARLEDIGASGPVAVAEAAYRSFLARVPGADPGSSPDLPLSLRRRASAERRTLDLHAIALIGVLGGQADDPLRDVLGHELRYAERALAARAQIPPGADDSVVERLVLAPTLVTVLGSTAAVSVVKRLAAPLQRRLEAPESIAVTLAGLYEPESADAFWGQLRPDRLAECLLQDVATSFGSAVRTSDYLRAALGDTTPERAAAMITVMLRAVKTEISPAIGLMSVLRQLTTDDPPILAPAALVASATDPDGPEVLKLLSDLLDSANLATVQALHDHLPVNFRDFSEYATFGVALMRRFDVVLAEGGHDERDRRRADNFQDLGLALQAIGQTGEAITWLTRAREAYLASAHTDPATLLSKVALAVNGIGLCLSDQRQHRTAAETHAEAAEYCRGAIAGQPSVEARDRLAMILGNLSNALLTLGRHTAALAPAQEAVQIREALIEDNSGDPRFRPGLVRSLTTLADVTIANGRLGEAQKLARRAVDEATKLTPATSSTIASITASALSCLGGCLGRLDDYEQAAEILREAADIMVRLHAHSPKTHMEEVVGTLANLAVALSHRGRYSEAHTRMDQAQRLVHEAGSADPTLVSLSVHTAARHAELLLETENLDLAQQLSQWSYDHSDLEPLRRHPGRPDTPAHAALVRAKVLHANQHSSAALAVIDQACSRYRHLTDTLDGAFRGDLATALGTKRDIHSELDDHEAAVAAGSDAVAIWEQLIASGATVHETDLAEILALISRDLRELDRWTDAITAATRARALAEGRTDRKSRHATAHACNVLTLALRDTDSAEAIAAGRSAVRLFGELAEEKPLKYGEALAEAWTDLGFAYSAAGRLPEALQASIAAVREIETLIEAGSDGDRVYAKCLRNLSCDLLAAHQPAEAASASRAAIRILKGLPDLTIKDALEIRGNLTNLVDQCLAMNNYHEAELARREIERIDPTLGRS